ncbi:nicotinate-nucleotide adenylyltransferase [Martelella alba]|uniref:Probable nicotinate-nucleotide adenylyltransferase n=1 Tax=Martelella alba TaxID=2590451 RepID=A0ABY2SNZ1_9HYPH|nr:nicotinate-nucleotide adenylyltransferase [Martelella alba]TKI05479.1 nicotinate-nucleotide adenylyltransferase [Martelella alba]
MSDTGTDLALTALFGGTFDPIHYGHLKPVIALAKMVGLQRVTLLPNNVPPHRPQPEASAQQRLAMVEMALEDIGGALFDIDDRELKRDDPSWTVDTFETLRQERGRSAPLGFIIGQDSLLTLPRWHRGLELLDKCHLLVCARPGYGTKMDTPELQSWLEARLTTDAGRLHRQPAGLIYLASTPQYSISASIIRERRRRGQRCNDMLPPSVQRYIDEQGLYR